MDLICGEGVCCPKCTKPASFQHVVDLDNVGITILKYVADIIHSHRAPTMKDSLGVRNIHDHDTNNIFVIINTNSEGINNISSEDIQPKFDINKVTCPRCRYRAEKALNLLQSNANLRIEDIKGICDHCKAQQPSQKPCAICEEIVKKFLHETHAQEKTDSTWYKQKVSHIHRPLSSDRGVKKIHLDTDRHISVVDSSLDLKLALKTKTELYKPLLVPPKHQVTARKSIEVDRKGKDTPTFKEFPSDESVVTSFITTFSKPLKDRKEKSFKYIFPEQKVKTQESKAVEITSSELIRTTQDKVRQQLEAQGEIGENKYDKYYDQRTKDDKDRYQETKVKTSEIEPSSHKVKIIEEAETKPQAQLIKDKKSGKGEVRPQSSEIKPSRSVKSLLHDTKDVVRPRSSEIKPSRSGVKSQTSEIKPPKSVKDQAKPPSRDTKSGVKTQPSEIKPPKTVKDQAKPPSHDTKSGVKPQPPEIKPPKTVKDQEKPPPLDTKLGVKPKPSEIKSSKIVQDQAKLPSHDTKGGAKPQPSEMKSPKTVKDQAKPPPQDTKLGVKPKPSEIKPPKIVKDQAKPPSHDTKGEVKTPPPEIKSPKSVKDQAKPPSHDTKGGVKPQTTEIKPPKSIKEVKPPLPKKSEQVDAKKSVEDKAKPSPKEPKTELKSEKKPTSQDLQTKKGKQGEEKPVSREDTTKKAVDKPQSKEIKKVEKPPKKLEGKPPSDVTTKTKYQDEGKIAKQEDKSKQVDKKKQIKDTEDKKRESNKQKLALQDEIIKKDKENEKKSPSRKIPEPPSKPPPTKEKSSTNDVKLEKEVKPQAEVKKTKKDEEKKPPKNKQDDQVTLKSKVTQTREAENRRNEKKLQAKQKLENQQEKPEESKLKEEIKEEKPVKKEEIKKPKEKVDEKVKVPSSTPPKKETHFDIAKFLPPPKQQVQIKVTDPLASVKLAEQRLKELEHTGLLVKAEAAKRGALKELQELKPTGQYNLFKIKVRGVPEPAEEKKKKKLKDLHLSKVEMKTMKMRGPSYDDLILKMVKLGEKFDKRSRKGQHKIQRQIKGRSFKIRSAKKTLSLWSLSIDSEVELEIDRLAHLVTIKQIRDKIQGTQIVKNVPEVKKTKLQPDPIIFYKNHEEEPSVQVYDIEEETKEPESATPRGVVRYSLSDPRYIERGWTMLPTMKVVRKMNIYKVRPAYPEFDWFNHNKNRGILNYESGEKLADFDDNGRGRWFYKNGRIALDYYDSEDVHAQQRFVLYGSGEEDEKCHSLVTVLGLFDYLGNGVVFDHNGKIRVKYNQTEGVLLDSGIGPSSRWKWHTLNDPPVLKQVMVDTFTDHPDPYIQKYDEESKKPHVVDEQMLAIEIENVIKDKTKMQKQRYKQFQIKMKALKINKQLSLKILDQAHVYLYFREGTTNLKLNLGMVLDHHEIIDTDTADLGAVSNILEKNAPETDSIIDLQGKLEKIRRCDRERTEHAMNVRTILPVSSADKLVRALSKPLRPPISNECAHPEDIAYSHRKPSTMNMYYNTRLI